MGRVARIHSGYIRIKTNRLAEDEVLVIPVLVEVTRSEWGEGGEGGEERRGEGREERGGEGRGGEERGGKGGEGRVGRGGEGRGGEGRVGRGGDSTWLHVLPTSTVDWDVPK